MSAGELLHRSPLALPERAWGRRPFLRSRHSSRVSWLQRLVGTLLVYEGSMGLLGSLAFAWKLPWFEGVSPLTPWILALSASLEIGLGVCVRRGDSPRMRRFLGALLFAEAASSGIKLLATGAFTESPWPNVAFMLVWACLGLGVWRAREWGRRGCVIFGLATYGYHLSYFVASMHGSLSRPRITFMAIAFVILVVPYVLLAIYGVLPATREHFAQARAEA